MSMPAPGFTRRNRRRHAALTAGIVVVAFAVWRFVPPPGPLAPPTSAGWAGFGIATPVGEKVMFASDPLENTTAEPIIVTGVTLTNQPLGLTVHAGLSLGPDVGVSRGWEPTSPLPFTVPSGRTAFAIIEVAARQFGTSTIDGLLITYSWRGVSYEAFLPDTFTVCAAATGTRAEARCNNLPTGGPLRWPWASRFATWITHW